LEIELIGELAGMLRFGMGSEAPSGASDRQSFQFVIGIPENIVQYLANILAKLS
jgi:hypothetical protein